MNCGVCCQPGSQNPLTFEQLRPVLSPECAFLERAASPAASMPRWPSCRGLKLPLMYTRPLRGALTTTEPCENSTVLMLPASSSSKGSASSVVSSCRPGSQALLTQAAMTTSRRPD